MVHYTDCQDFKTFKQGTHEGLRRGGGDVGNINVQFANGARGCCQEKFLKCDT